MNPFHLSRNLSVLFLAFATACSTLSAAPPEVVTSSEGLGKTISTFRTDYYSLSRFYNIRISPTRWNRMERFLRSWQERLGKVEFGNLDHTGKIDFLLLNNEIAYELIQIGHQRERFAEVSALLPFAPDIIALEEARWKMGPVDAKRAAATLSEISSAIEELKKKVKKDSGTQAKETNPPVEAAAEKSGSLRIRPVLANRAARMVDQLSRTLSTWNKYYSGFQPDFTWWTEKPYADTSKALKDYGKFLKEKIAGLKGKDDDPLLGDPIGKQALLDDLRHEMIPYSPEEMIRIGEREFAWCEEEMIKAAKELGFQEWKEALEHVKNLHAEPGEQDDMVTRQAKEAIAWLEENDLITIPDLAKELWRLQMLGSRAQRNFPFASYGGQHMNVAFATQDMEHDQKLMSMRGNNIHFTRNVTPHELIPGHHLQGFMAQRYKTHRRMFGTPFFGEGWALYWEMLSWDLGWPRGPEDRIGMLFWRMHRAARIIVSLKFHLGEMQPREMIDFLVQRVGHEEMNATSEVRRFIGGSYSPLYQCGYMIGGLQLRALHGELVGTGKMTHREFHDAVLRENSIPNEMIRASLTGQSLERNHTPSWKFAGENL